MGWVKARELLEEGSLLGGAQVVVEGKDMALVSLGVLVLELGNGLGRRLSVAIGVAVGVAIGAFVQDILDGFHCKGGSGNRS